MSETARRVTIHVIRERPRPVELSPIKEVADSPMITTTAARVNSYDHQGQLVWEAGSTPPTIRKPFQPASDLGASSPLAAAPRARNFSLPTSHIPLFTGTDRLDRYPTLLPPWSPGGDGKRCYESSSSHDSDDSPPCSPGGSSVSTASEADSIVILNFAAQAAQERRKRVHGRSS